MNSWAMFSLFQKRWRAIASSGLARRNSSIALAFPFKTNAAASELISFLKALPDCRLRRGIRYPQSWMLLVAILAIYCFAEG